MKILVLGSTGMAGHTISLYFKQNGHNVIAYSTKPFPYCENIIGNAFNTDNLLYTLKNGNYDVVINCIGLLNIVAESNPSKAVYLNSYLPHLISDCLKNSNTKFIQMSTDCVFSGNTGPYNEDSLKDGRTFYDRTKSLGEIENDKDLTFRNSIIGPDMNPNGIGLLNWFMKQKGEINGYTGAIWTGVTTLTLAKAMEQAITENVSGLYNLVNNESISKYDLLCLLNKHLRKNQLAIHQDNKLLLDKTLKNNRTDFSFKVPSYEEMIMEMKKWIDNHKNLYSHYYPKI